MRKEGRYAAAKMAQRRPMKKERWMEGQGRIQRESIQGGGPPVRKPKKYENTLKKVSYKRASY